MATEALHGSPMEPSDLRTWPRIKTLLKFVFWEAVLAFVFCQLVGLNSPKLREAAWRDFMLASAVMMTSRVLSLRLFWLLQSSPTMNVLWHLPVAGRDICRWVRRTSLLGSLKLLPRMTVAAWAWQSFPSLEVSWMQTLWNGFALWLVMLACVQHCSHAQGVGRLVGKFWNLTLGVWLCLSLYALLWEKNLASGQPLPAWITQVCAPAAWVLPAQWAMHAQENQTALVLALVCVAFGGLLWWRLPDALAIAYDRLVLIAVPASKGLEEAEEEKLARQEPEALQAGHVMTVIRQAADEETSFVREGWIEKLLLMLLQKRDRMLGPNLIDLQAGWTSRWWKGVRICTLFLAIAYALMEFGSGLIKAETLEFWIHILPLIVVVGYTFPLSNSIPLATLSYPLSQHGMPLFAGLPICMRDLLRVSFRITVARMIAFLALALPVIAAQCTLLNHKKAIPAMLGIAVILSISWILLRPAFIYYRLQEMSRPGNRHRFGHACAYLLIVPLALGILFSTLFSVTMIQANPAWPAVALTVTACCARAIYAIFQWRVRTRKVDWTTDSSAQP